MEVLELEVQKLKVRELEVKEQEIKELEVQKLEGRKFIAPRVVEKASVTLPSSARMRGKPPFAPSSS